MHSDSEAILLQKGSKSKDLWGFNIYPDLPKTERLEFDSLINIRSGENLSMNIKDKKIRQDITDIVNELIIDEE